MQRFGDPAIYESNFIPVGMPGGSQRIPQGFTDPKDRAEVLEGKSTARWKTSVALKDCPLVAFSLAPLFFSRDGKDKEDGRLSAISRSGQWWVVSDQDANFAVFKDGQFQRFVPAPRQAYVLSGISDSGITFGYVAERRNRTPVWEFDGRITSFRNRGFNMLMPLQMGPGDKKPGLTLAVGSSGDIQYYRLDNADADPIAITEHEMDQVGEIADIGTYEYLLNLNGLGVFRPTTPYMRKTPLVVTQAEVAPPPVLAKSPGVFFDIDDLNQAVGVVASWPVLVSLDKDQVTPLPSPGCCAATAISSDGRFIAGTPGAHAQPTESDLSEKALVLWREGKPFRIESEELDFLEPQVMTRAGTLVVYAMGSHQDQHVRQNVLLCPKWPQ